MVRWERESLIHQCMLSSHQSVSAALAIIMPSLKVDSQSSSHRMEVFLASDWPSVIRWSGYWPLIVPEWSGDPDTCLWLAQSDQVIWILASDWPRVIRWSGYWLLIGPEWSGDPDTCLWLVVGCVSDGRTYFSDQFSSPVAKYFSPGRRVEESLSGFLRGNNLDLFVTTKLRNASALKRGQCLSSVRDSLFGKWMLRINQRNKKLYHASNSVASHPRILMALENNLLFQKD